MGDWILMCCPFDWFHSYRLFVIFFPQKIFEAQEGGGGGKNTKGGDNSLGPVIGSVANKHVPLDSELR
jgi:hypothetical protein